MAFVLVEPISMPKYALLTASVLIQNRYQPQFLKDAKQQQI